MSRLNSANLVDPEKKYEKIVIQFPSSQGMQKLAFSVPAEGANKEEADYIRTVIISLNQKLKVIKTAEQEIELLKRKIQESEQCSYDLSSAFQETREQLSSHILDMANIEAKLVKELDMVDNEILKLRSSNSDCDNRASEILKESKAILDYIHNFPSHEISFDELDNERQRLENTFHSLITKREDLNRSHKDDMEKRNAILEDLRRENEKQLKEWERLKQYNQDIKQNLFNEEAKKQKLINRRNALLTSISCLNAFNHLKEDIIQFNEVLTKFKSFLDSTINKIPQNLSDLQSLYLSHVDGLKDAVNSYEKELIDIHTITAHVQNEISVKEEIIQSLKDKKAKLVEMKEILEEKCAEVSLNEYLSDEDISVLQQTKDNLANKVNAFVDLLLLLNAARKLTCKAESSLEANMDVLQRDKEELQRAANGE